jgi:hypothetical protein
MVCRVHGGSAPQVKEASRLRMARLVDPSLDYLASIIKPTKKDKALHQRLRESERIKVCHDMLDRTGHKHREEILITTEFDAARMSMQTEAELKLLADLGRKISRSQDVHGGNQS